MPNDATGIAVCPKMFTLLKLLFSTVKLYLFFIGIVNEYNALE
jgi:hypothetical protein